jgi:hypothetical protein
MVPRPPLRIAVLLVAIALASSAALAQTPGSSGPAESESGFSGPGGHHGAPQSDQGGGHPDMPMPRLKRAPWQRLDVGALFCPTVAQLRQHQQAVMARLQGGDAPEPHGCRLIKAMVPVSVLDRDGPARTEIQMHDAAAETGWTDAVIRDPLPGASAPPGAGDGPR